MFFRISNPLKLSMFGLPVDAIEREANEKDKENIAVRLL